VRSARSLRVKLTVCARRRLHRARSFGRSVDKWLEPAISPRNIRADIDHCIGRQRAVQMRKQHRRGIVGHAGLPADRSAQPVRVEVEQHQIDTAREETIGRQMDLVLRREMNETHLTK